jgi:PAS domain S-box-containing protein
MSSLAQPLRCLLVEDSEDDARLLLRHLRDVGYDVTSERVDTPEAMQAALTLKPWDLVLSDYRMPHFNGLAALELLQASGRDLPFILVSGTIGEAMAVAAMKAGAHDYLMKDNLGRLGPAVQRELRQAEERRARGQAEMALRASDERRRAILETAMDGFCLVDTKGRLLEANGTYARMSGYSVEELLGLHMADLMVTETAVDLAERLQEILRQGDGRFETKLRRKDGSLFDAEISVQFRSGEGGMFVCFLHDITARKQAEANLQASQTKAQELGSLLNSILESPQGMVIFALDANYRYTAFTAAHKAVIQTIWGVEIGLGMNMLDVIKNSGDREKAKRNFDRALAGEHLLLVEEYGTPPNRTFYEDRYGPVLDEGGQVVGLAVFVSDITKQKRAETAIRASKQQYDDLVAKIPVGVYILRSTPEGAFSLDFASPRMAEMLGLSVESLLEDVDRVSQAIHPEDRAGFIQLNVDGIKHHQPFDWEGRALVKGAVKWLHIESAPEPLENGDVAWNGVVLDITAGKADQARIHRLTQLYLALSQCNQAIVRATNEQTLLPEVCRGAVLFGGMKMAWIGMVDKPAGRILPTASFGDDTDYLKDIEIPLDEADVHSHGPTGTAIREDRPDWCQDYQTDPRLAPWRERGLRAGWGASAALPLRRNGVTIGALTLYSDKVNAFDEDARNLLLEMAADISHALDTFDVEAQRKHSEKALADNRVLLGSIINGTTDAIYAKDLEGRYLLFNPGAEAIVGNLAANVLGQDDTFIFPPEDAAVVMDGDRKVMESKAVCTFEETMTNAEGKLINLLATKGPLFSENGKLLGLFGVSRDITERKRSEESLQASLREKESLLKEVHHRVKNNLQVITSLLRLEAGRSDQPAVKSVLKDMQNRIRSMAMLHEAIYRSESLEHVNLSTYIKQLAAHLYRSVVAEPGNIQLHLSLEPVNLTIDQALPCGLLVNELVSNAFKHGFPDGRKGEVRIELQLMDEGPNIRLRVSDTGMGLPPDFEEKRTTSLGLQLVSDLVKQLKAQLEISGGPSKGAVFEVTFTPKKEG